MCGEGGEYESLVLDCPLFKHARIVLDEWQCVVQSPDSFAPVGLLQPTAFHLEPKGTAAEASQQKSAQDLHPHSAQGLHPPSAQHLHPDTPQHLHPHSAHDLQQPPALGLDKPHAMSQHPQTTAGFTQSAAAASGNSPVQLAVIEVPADFHGQAQETPPPGSSSTGNAALPLGPSHDALPAVASVSSGAPAGTSTTPASKTERVLLLTSSSASPAAAGSTAGPETAEQVLLGSQPTAIREAAGSRESANQVLLGAQHAAAGVPQWSTDVQLQQGQYYTRAWCCPTAAPAAQLGSSHQTGASLDAALHAIQTGRRLGCTCCTVCVAVECERLGFCWSVPKCSMIHRCVLVPTACQDVKLESSHTWQRHQMLLLQQLQQVTVGWLCVKLVRAPQLHSNAIRLFGQLHSDSTTLWTNLPCGGCKRWLGAEPCPLHQTVSLT